MIGRSILGAIALFLIFESLYPLLGPEQWRNTLRKLIDVDTNTIRRFAFVVFITGAILWFVVFHT